MDVWSQGRTIVEEVFFKDTVELYRNNVAENALGEEIDEEVLVGTYNCNIENGASGVARNEAGTSTPQSLRISLSKSTPLAYDHTYKIKIVSARIGFSTNEWWNVDGWTEAQLSTVITASREVSV